MLGMDINLLVLNLGNSRLAIGVFEAGELTYSNRISNDLQNDWPGVIAEAWKKLSDSESPAVAAASVNPSLDELLEKAVKKASGLTVEWIGRDIELPIPVKTVAPDATGVDRILNIAAAYEQMQKACVVVDAGSAITVDVCDDRGQFLGGAIAPGVGLLLQSLHRGTAKLPNIAFSVPTSPIGTDTEQAILNGIYHGIRGMVKELVENYATELGSWPDLIATGGDAMRLFHGWELIHAVSPDLTLYGIALAYTQHHIHHGETT